METYSINFFSSCGQAIQVETNYNNCTAGGTQNLTHFRSEVLWVQLQKSIEYLRIVFREITKDYASGELTESDHRRYLKYFSLLIEDTQFISGKLKENKQLMEAVQKYKLAEALEKLTTAKK